MNDNENTSKSLLKVGFHASGIGVNIRDEQSEAELAARHGMDPKRVRATKKILGDALRPVQSEIGKIRRYLKLNTFDGIGGTRIMVAVEADRIRRQVAQHVSEAYKGLDQIIYGYETLIDEERVALNERFNRDDYPESGESLRRLFSFDLEIEPMPDPNQFRLIQELTDHEREDMAARLEAQIQAARSNMQAETIRRTLDLIKEVADTLGDPDKPIVDSEGRKGCIPKLREHLERLPNLNIDNDPTLTALRSEVLSALELNAESLRESKGARSRTAFMAENLHKKFSSGFSGRALTA